MAQLKRSRVCDLLKSKDFDRDVQVKGWVRTKRGNKKIAFIALNDGSIIHNIQIVADIANFDENTIKQITLPIVNLPMWEMVREPGTLLRIEGH